MCVKGVNATVSMFSDVVNINKQGALAFYNPFDQLKANLKNDGLNYIGGFFVIVDLNLLSTTDPKFQSENVVFNKQTLKVIVRLTKSSENPDKVLSLDLAEFDINTSEDGLIKKNACVEYINLKKIIRIDTDAIQLSPNVGIGSYVIKILVKRPCDEELQVQSIYNFEIL